MADKNGRIVQCRSPVLFTVLREQREIGRGPPLSVLLKGVPLMAYLSSIRLHLLQVPPPPNSPHLTHLYGTFSIQIITILVGIISIKIIVATD